MNGSLANSLFGSLVDGDLKLSTPGERYGSGLVEVTGEAEDGWTEVCEELCEGSLFKKTSSWIFGANLPGKKNVVMFYFGGLGNFRAKLQEVTRDGYRGFRPF